MSLFTSSSFAAAAASGTDWRDTARAVLEKLESIRTGGHRFNFGFLYVSDHLADDAQSILNLFKSVLDIEHWIGGVAMGVCACGESYIDKPAISAMLCQFDKDDFCMIPPFEDVDFDAGHPLKKWLRENDPMLTFVHGDPLSELEPGKCLQQLEQMCGGFLTGGLTSSRKAHAQFADDLHAGSLCGAIFSSRVAVASTLSQGCTIMGDTHTITRADEHFILELDSQKALGVFEGDIRKLAIRMIGKDPDQIMVEEEALYEAGKIPEDFNPLLKGEVHAALPISESDQHDYLVRNIVGIDPDKGTISIAETIASGDRVLFVHRDHASVYKDLSASLVALRKRVQHDTGTFEPKGAVYVSCVARAFNVFTEVHAHELALIRDIIGDVPLTGFYAGGEISKGRLYGYTGILTLFL